MNLLSLMCCNFYINSGRDTIPENTTTDDLDQAAAQLAQSFEQSGDKSQIALAIQLWEKVLELIPDDHVSRPRMLNNLSNGYRLRFLHLGELDDIETAIVTIRQAVELTLDDHPQKPDMLNNLGAAYVAKFDHLGQLSDIDTAIVALSQAMEITDGHAGRSNNLGSAYFARFLHLGELNDLESAILAFKQAVELTPNDHPSKPARLNNIGTAHVLRFESLGNHCDIESAIVTLKQAVEITPDGHFSKPWSLMSLGRAYQCRFDHLEKQEADIESAIIALKHAVELTPDSHPLKPGRLNNLSSAYESKSSCLGGLDDIESSILTLEQAIALSPEDHAQNAGMLTNLGNVYQSKFSHSQNIADLDSALLSFQKASFQSTGKPFFQLQAAVYWSTLCSTPSMALKAYTRFFELIPRVVWLGQTIGHRYKEVARIGNTIGTAVATAISVGDLPLAIEWLEEGRSIIWGQIHQLRSPFTHLYDQHPEIAKQLQTVAQALDHAGTLPNQDIFGSMDKSKGAGLEKEAQSHRELARKYENLIRQIQSLPGFSSFLKAKPFSELASAAANGHVVILNVHVTCCDALVLCPSGDIIHVPLPNFSKDQARKLQEKLISSLQKNNVRIEHDDDEAKRLKTKNQGANNDHLASILASLWTNVVQPIWSNIEAKLPEKSQDNIPRITWCASGPFSFLPLHAAGIYTGPIDKYINISDFVVSSYTTTLRALIDATQKQRSVRVPSVLIVSQPATPGYPNLPGTLEEAKVIEKYTGSAKHLMHDEATTEAVIQDMDTHDIVHFACHGIQDFQDPLDSAFVLYDQKLKLKTLMSLSLKNAQLAFLSACETATGDEKLPEEAVHLAASMLAIGYPSVVATLWSIGDKEAPYVADKFYEKILVNCVSSRERKQSLSSAYALHEATKSLREEVGVVNFIKWVPFIHFGA
ncbi:TPR-like protein [Gymnopus androsaceus JB14]|uniref:TPR-like protein n=1 Tax=Gymnopus androsaceus JB14 TaxID=1447944 RepID=A0A6A4HQ16_9AGAR|nr:TPR-like protein [Gymnopus androsaceus JB14]